MKELLSPGAAGGSASFDEAPLSAVKVDMLARYQQSQPWTPLQYDRQDNISSSVGPDMRLFCIGQLLASVILEF